MTCKRCENRTLLETTENNAGYCDKCILLIGREFSHDETFTAYITVKDNAWKLERHNNTCPRCNEYYHVVSVAGYKTCSTCNITF